MGMWADDVDDDDDDDDDEVNQQQHHHQLHQHQEHHQRKRRYEQKSGRPNNHHRRRATPSIEQSLQRNSGHIGKKEERMFFSVCNVRGKIGKTLFDNPAQYAIYARVVLAKDVYSKFSRDVRQFLREHTEEEQSYLQEINPEYSCNFISPSILNELGDGKDRNIEHDY